MKFSIIMPVFNVEEYIDKSLGSLKCQTFKEFEVIIVNDGSEDNSQKIIDKYVEFDPVRFKSYSIENIGPGGARNYGIKKAEGDYLIFLDADDYLDEIFFEKLNDVISKEENIDLIRVPSKRITTDGNILKQEILKEEMLSGEDLFNYLRDEKKCIEAIGFYIIKRKFWNDNKFEFPVDKWHEDFRIMLIAILKAKKTYIANSIYYNYVYRENSTMNNQNYTKELKKSYDKLEHYDEIIKELDEVDNVSINTKRNCRDYISIAVCMSVMKLKPKDRKKYRQELKNRKVLKNIQSNNLKKIIKKIVITLMIYNIF